MTRPLAAPLRSLVEEFAGQKNLPPNAANDVEAAIASSPYLAHVMIDAAKLKTLKHIDITSEKNEDGHYEAETGTIFIALERFNRGASNHQERVDHIAGVLGHETGHALTQLARAAEVGRLARAIEIKLTDGLGSVSNVDLTPDVERYLNFTRNDEALSELIGMNSVASRVASTEPGGYTRASFLRRVDDSTECVGREGRSLTEKLSDGIQLSPHGFQLTGNRFKSPAVEAVATCHYDTATTLGRHGDSNYRNYYGPSVFVTIAAMHADVAKSTTQAVPEVHLDLKRLKLDLAQIERNGVDLPANAKRFGFTDTSDGKLTWKTVNDTRTGPPEPTPKDAAIASRPAFRADSPGHPDYPTFAMLHRAAQADGRWSEAEARNLAAAGLAAVKADPTVGQHLAGAVVGKGTDGATNFIGYASPHGPAGPHHHLAVDAAAAAQLPAAQSLDRVEQLNRQQAQPSTQAQTLATDGPQHSGPKMTL